jgi:hypothetical protein
METRVLMRAAREVLQEWEIPCLHAYKDCHAELRRLNGATVVQHSDSADANREHTKKADYMEESICLQHVNPAITLYRKWIALCAQCRRRPKHMLS